MKEYVTIYLNVTPTCVKVGSDIQLKNNSFELFDGFDSLVP